MLKKRKQKLRDIIRSISFIEFEKYSEAEAYYFKITRKGKKKKK